ncbi:hypothetical protein DFH09DRAFT_1083409 [Mycena vulgaris]|nr:hypothetical protein DFH09DRAFT_1083409 [Mycena vulgaris]
MSLSGVTYYDKGLKHLVRLLKALPESIPIGEAHNFMDYVPDPKKVADTGRVKSVASHSLEVSFGARRTPTGETVIIVFKSRGPALQEVATVLRDHITGNAGQNILLTLWVDDLTTAATAAVTGAGLPLPREAHTTFAKRVLVDKAVEENAAKKQRRDEKGAKDASKARTAAKKKTEQGAVNWSFDDLENDPPPAPATATARGAPKIDILDKLVIPCH